MSFAETPLENREQLQDRALCRSVLYGALSVGLYVPSEATLCALQSKNMKLAVQAAALLLADGQETEAGQEDAPGVAADLVRSVEDWLRTLEPFTLEEWLGAHGRLFGHTARGPVCPYEAEYGQEGLFEQPRQLAKITGFYKAFGLTPRESERERPDHISCELEFLEFLSRKEAFALHLGDEAMWSETRKAVRLFLRDYTGKFGLAFARLLREQDPAGFCGKLGDVLSSFLKMECRRVGVQPGPLMLPLRSAEEDKVPMACGDQSELVQLQVPQ